MMMKTIVKYSICSLLFAGLLCGCNDSKFLEENPETFYTVDNAFSTSEQVDQVLVSCYSHIRVMMCMVEENNTAWAFKGGNGTDMFDMATIRRSSRFNDYSTRWRN